MSVRGEFLAREIADYVKHKVRDMRMDDIAEYIEGKALDALQEIQDVLNNGRLSDFEAVEAIVCIFEEYGLRGGCIHDFG